MVATVSYLDVPFERHSSKTVELLQHEHEHFTARRFGLRVIDVGMVVQKFVIDVPIQRPCYVTVGRRHNTSCLHQGICFQAYSPSRSSCVCLFRCLRKESYIGNASDFLTDLPLGRVV